MIAILIISAVICVIAAVYAVYGHKRDIRASERLEWADRTYRYAHRAWPARDDLPLRYDIREMNPGSIAVYSTFVTADGHLCEVVVKSFKYGKDGDDREFAIREAEELLETLKEK